MGLDARTFARPEFCSSTSSGTYLCSLPGKFTGNPINHYSEHQCQQYDSSAYVDHNLVSQVQRKYMKLGISSLAKMSNIANASQIARFVARCDQTAFVAPTRYIKSREYFLSTIFGGESSHLNRKPYLESTDTFFHVRFIYWCIKLVGLAQDLK